MVKIVQIPCYLLLLLLCWHQCAFSATVTARLDRNPISIDESVTLQLIIEDPSKAEPDFSPLQPDFDILQQSSGTNMQFINGKRSHFKQYQLQLMPKRIGRLMIPSIKVGKESSNALELIVTSSAPSNRQQGNQDFFLELSAEPEKAYVRQQVLLTVRLYIGASLAQGSLSEPKPLDADIHKLGDDREFTTSRGSRHYRVLERRYAIFPHKAGMLTIEPLFFQGQMGRPSSSFFDPFSQGGRTKRLRSNQLELDIHPRPAQAPPVWLPAGKVTGKMALSSAEGLRAGEPLTVTISLEAVGLTGKSLPELTLPSMEHIRVYPDQPQFQDLVTATGIVGRLDKKIALVADKAGNYQLPPLTIPWWNIQTDSLEYARIEPREFTVLPPVQERAQAALEEKIPETEAAVGASGEPAQTLTFREYRGAWLWLSVFLFFCWLITLFFLVQARKRKIVVSTEQDTGVNPAYRAAEKQLQKSCLHNQPQQARLALNQLLFFQEAAEVLQGEEQENALLREQQKLNEYLYAAKDLESGSWNGSPLWKAWQDTMTKKETGKKQVENGLPPLYQEDT